MPRNYTEEELAWVSENYPCLGMEGTAEAFETEFGYRRGARAISVKAHRMGLHVWRADATTSKAGCVRKVYWSREPVMSAWMAENDHGRITATIDAFEAEFGFRLTRAQVNLYRQTHGTVSRKSWRTSRIPVGTERVSKGYVWVKVRDHATVPGSKDDWEQKSHVVWEMENGRPVPDGCEVTFCDGDHRNFDPENLMAVPKAVVGIINGQHIQYHDEATLETAVAIAKLAHAAGRAGCRPRPCETCGREFTPEQPRQTNCRECIDSGAAARTRARKVWDTRRGRKAS